MKNNLKRRLCMLLVCALLVPCLSAPASAIQFTDVPANHWTAPSIQRCVDLGFFKGETATSFGLGHDMTRAAFAVVLSRFFGWETPAVTTSSYADVPADAWYAAAVEAGLRNGAFTLQTREFRPGESITREEMAVMLTRALGYNPLAGLAQELPSLLEDVTTNPGYIALSQEMGLVTGTTATSFAPDRAATREEVAVTLIRLYDKLHAGAPGKVGVVRKGENLPDLAGFEAVAVNNGQLINMAGQVKLTGGMNETEIAAARSAAKTAGAKQLLYVSGTSGFLRGSTSQAARMLADKVAAGGYDGLYLDVQELQGQSKRAMTTLVTALRSALGTKLLYVAVEAPSWHDTNYQGYDYGELGKLADRLVLRIAPAQDRTGEVVLAPAEPLEEVYYAMAAMNNMVDMGKVSLLLTTTAEVYVEGQRKEVIAGTAVKTLQEETGLPTYWSARYAASYLHGEVEQDTTTVWYTSGDGVRERVKLAACFDVDQICLASLEGVTAEVLDALK